MPSRTPRVLSLALLSTALVLGSLAAPARADEPDPDPTAPLVDDATAAADEALDTVRDLLDEGPDVGTFGTEPDEPADHVEHADLTMALRDLALLKNDLPTSERREAERLLARPTDGPGDQYGDGYRAGTDPQRACSNEVCVHYVTTSRDRVDTTDNNGNDRPDYVDFALKIMTDVHRSYVAGGFRPPKSDQAATNNGGDGRTDIYLTDIGGKGYYGYCATDQNLPLNQPQDTWAYCVLDNDYSRAEFGSRKTPQQNFQVTAAHEYFHAVQYGYDVSEDRWVMEATATWAEDQLYDGVNDNRAYLRGGPMRLPHRSLDTFAGTFHYGTWIFFRYLTERFPDAQGKLPILVRDLWRRLDDAPGGIGEYSLQGLKKVLRKRNLSLTKAFAGFSAANRTPGRNYQEGKHYPKAPLAASTWLSRNKRAAGPLRLTLDHLAAGTVRYTPGRTLKGGAWRLRLILDMKARWKGSGAIVTIKPRSGKPRTKWVTLNKRGDDKTVVNFSRRRTKWVEVTLVNASDHFRCHRGTRFSCEGKPRFDNMLERIRAKAYKAG
jgi:hypothetical protein